MALYTLVIEHDDKSYSTQVLADNASEAVSEYLAHIYPNTRAQAFGDASPQLGPADLIYMTPMQGLVNLWAACAGREGHYINLVCVNTVQDQEAK
jgi:hypothetical protein